MSSININEIVVRADQTPGKVCFHNFEEIKSYMEAKLSVYDTTVYTPDDLDTAREDLSVLKAIKKSLTEKKKELETAYSMPIEAVKAQLDELIGMVKAPMDIIDKMIKETEKKAKREEIEKYSKEKAVTLGEYADKVIGSRAFFNDKWLNISCKTKQWKEDVDKIIADAADAIDTITGQGGDNKAALLGFYFDKLSLDGIGAFKQMISSDVGSDADLVTVSASEDDADKVIGYKVFKIYGTKRQMLKVINMLDLSDIEYEEIEDGMPKDMEELTDPDTESFVCFDIEHTGTNGIDNGDAEAEIIEIGAVKVVDGKIVDKFDMLAYPGRKIIPRVAKLTHITDEMVAHEPPVDDVIRRFKQFVGDSILVGHNIKSCDIPHITRAAKRAGIKFENAFLDTKKLARPLQEQKRWEKITLPYLSDYYHISQTDAHRAWCDAEANAYLYLELRKEYLSK